LAPLFLVEEEYGWRLTRAEAGFIVDLIAKITDPNTVGPPWAHLGKIRSKRGR
jgi:hypothetical protein